MQRNNEQQFLLTKIENLNPLVDKDRVNQNDITEYIRVLYPQMKHTFGQEPDFKKTDGPDIVMSWICKEIKNTSTSSEWKFYNNKNNHDNCKLIEFYPLSSIVDSLMPLPISFMEKAMDKRRELFDLFQMFITKFHGVLFETMIFDHSDYYIENLLERIDYIKGNVDNLNENEEEIDDMENELSLIRFMQEKIFNNFGKKSIKDKEMEKALISFKPKNLTETKLIAVLLQFFRLYKMGFSLENGSALPPSVNDDTGIYPVLTNQMYQLTWFIGPDCFIENYIIESLNDSFRETGGEILMPILCFVTDEKNLRLTEKEKIEIIKKENEMYQEYSEIMLLFEETLKELCYEYRK